MTSSSKNLLTIKDLELDSIKDWVAKALSNVPYREQRDSSAKGVALIFLEASTRTRCSFERACQRLSLDYTLVESKGSSVEKSESLKDTILTLRSLDYGTFVVRLKEEGLLKEVATKIGGVRFICAGEGRVSHPTQALGDLASLVSFWGGFEQLKGKKVCVVGDLLHSRVAQSFSEISEKVGLELVLLSPRSWAPKSWVSSWRHTEDKKEALKNADAVMALRVQNERHENSVLSVEKDYIPHFQIKESDLKGGQVLMHPGPTNWGVELEKSLADYKNSLILYQIKMGLDLRTVLLAES